MFNFIRFGIFLFILSACGLNYIPPATKEDASITRRRSIEQYIQDQYEDSSATYQSLLFGTTTVVKPTNYMLLDSLFAIKYSNEQNLIYDPKLDEKIGNQQQVIRQDTAKVVYIEQHVYAISTKNSAEISFADVTVTSDFLVQNFEITEQQLIKTEHIDYYSSYLQEESIIVKGYSPTAQEKNFYDFYKSYYNELRIVDQAIFLNHTLKVMQVARSIGSLNNEKLIKALTIHHLFNRSLDESLDKFTSIDGFFSGEVLVEYITVLKSNEKNYIVKLSPYLEIISVQLSE